jgi:PST family polysaccharide transporter
MTDPGPTASRPLTDEDLGGLRATAANSVKWAMLQMVGATGGRLLFTLALARFLGPGDFGIVAQATIYITLAMLLLDQGFGSALVQRRDLEGADVRSVATLNLLLAVAFMLLTLLLAPAVAEFFKTPELTTVLRVLGVGLVVKGLTIVPLMMSRRSFQFRELALLQTGAVLVGGVAGLVAVVLDAGYWALVVQTIVADFLLMVGLFCMRGLPRLGIDGGRLRAMFGFSVGLVGAQLLWFAGQNADNIVIGRVLGPTALAYYALSYRLQRFPLQLIGSVVNDVSLPIFARLQDQPDRMRGWFFTATRFVTLLTWPILVLLAVAADVGVPFVFGPDWESAIVPLQLLTLGGLTMISRWLLSPLLTACGRTDLMFGWSAVTVGLMVTSFLIAVHWGIDAVALCVGLVALVVAIPQTLHVSRVMGLPWSRYIGAHLPVAVGSVVLAAIWRGTAAVLDRNGAGSAIVLTIATVLAVAGYVLAVRWLWPTVFTDSRAVFELAKEPRDRSSSP